MNNKRWSLTPREIEVVIHLANGLQNKEIADILRISMKTVDKQRQSIYDKLRVLLRCPMNRAMLTHFAVASGLIELQFTQQVVAELEQPEKPKRRRNESFSCQILRAGK